MSFNNQSSETVKKSFSEDEILRKISKKISSILAFECMCCLLIKAKISTKPSNCWPIQLLVSNVPDWMVATHTEILALLYTPPSNQEYIVKYVEARNLLCFNFGKPSLYANHDFIWCICHIVSLLEDFERFNKFFF